MRLEEVTLNGTVGSNEVHLRSEGKRTQQMSTEPRRRNEFVIDSACQKLSGIGASLQ